MMMWRLKHQCKYLHVIFKAFYKSVHPACTYVGACDKSRSVSSCILKGSWNNFFHFCFSSVHWAFTSVACCVRVKATIFNLSVWKWRFDLMILVSCCSQCSGRSFDNNQCLCSCSWKIFFLQVYILSNHHWCFVPETGRGWREVQQEVTMHKGGNHIRWNAYPQKDLS